MTHFCLNAIDTSHNGLSSTFFFLAEFIKKKDDSNFTSYYNTQKTEDELNVSSFVTI